MNVWKQFENLLPKDPLLIAEVTAFNSGDTCTVTFLGGGTAIVRGQTVAIGNMAFIQNNQIQGEAPDLPDYEFEV